MKAVLILLAVFCGAALANEHAGHTMDPCLKQCKAAMKTKLEADESLKKHTLDKYKTPEGRTKIRQHMRNWINGTATIVPNEGDIEGWTKLCTIATDTETCIDNCASAPADDRDCGKKFLHLYKVGCSPEWKAKAACLAEVFGQRSEACQAKCLPQASGLTVFLDQRDASPAEQVMAPKDVLTSTCKFANCRLNCRKADVVAKCGEDGYEQAKIFLASLSTTKKMTYKHFGGDVANWPTECESDKIYLDNTY